VSGDVLSRQLAAVAFAVVSGQIRLTAAQREAIADLNAAAALADRHEKELRAPNNVKPNPDGKTPA
jgi:hypothetical protein